MGAFTGCFPSRDIPQVPSGSEEWETPREMEEGIGKLPPWKPYPRWYQNCYVQYMRDGGWTTYLFWSGSWFHCQLCPPGPDTGIGPPVLEWARVCFSCGRYPHIFRGLSQKTLVRNEVVHGIIGTKIFHSWTPCRRSDDLNWRLGRPLLWGAVGSAAPWFLTGWANGMEVEFMIDTGCQVTILATTVFKRMCTAYPMVRSRLCPCRRRLVSGRLVPLDCEGGIGVERSLGLRHAVCGG